MDIERLEYEELQMLRAEEEEMESDPAYHKFLDMLDRQAEIERAYNEFGRTVQTISAGEDTLASGRDERQEERRDTD